MRASKIVILIVSMLVSPIMVEGQSDTALTGTFFFRSMRIVGNDTIVDERHFDMRNSGGSTYKFRFGDDTEEFFEQFESTAPFSDTLQKRLSDTIGFPSDSGRIDFRFSMPDIDWPGFDLRSFTPDIFQIPGDLFGRGSQSVSIPPFSVEDVELYSDDNTVRDFNVRPLRGTTILLVEANLDNKRSSYTVYDNRGNTLHFERLRRIEGKFRRVLDMTELESGTYFVEIKNGKSTKKKRITIR